MSRMTLLFVVFALTVSPSSTVLCGMWCNPSTVGLTEPSTPCRHHAAHTPCAELSGGNECGTAGVTPAVYVREGNALQGVPPVAVIQDSGLGYLALTRSIPVPAPVCPLHAAAFLTTLRI